MSYWNRYTVSWLLVFIAKLEALFLLCANLSSLSHPPPYLSLYRSHPSLHVNPNSPSLSILPFPNRSSHSDPVFVEEPVKVAPAAVQTLMAPHCVCAWKTPSHVPCWFVLAIITSDVSTIVTMAPRNERAEEGGRQRRAGICGEMKRKEGGYMLRRGTRR